MSYVTTWSQHSGFGHKELELEFGYRATGALGAPLTVTAAPPHGMAYKYDGSRVTHVATVLPSHFGEPFNDSVLPTVNWSATDASLQITRIEYGAPVIAANMTAIPEVVGEIDTVSKRNDLVSAVYMPSGANGQPETDPAYRFFYRPDGSLAARTDARDVTLSYAQDSAGNTVRIDVDSPDGAMRADELFEDSATFAPIGRIELDYDALGRLTLAKTYSRGTGTPLSSRSTLTLDQWGNIQSEAFRNPLLAFLGDRQISYDWSVGAAPLGAGTNTTRLNSITYPPRGAIGTWDGAGGGSPRVITYDYGPQGSIDDLLNRVRSLTSTGGPAASELGLLADYGYHGTGRLFHTQIGERPCNSAPNLTGVLRELREYDHFNRLTLQEVTSRACDGIWETDPILAADHAHDEAGRRLMTRLRQADFSSPGDRDDIRSFLYEYDTFGRLTGSQRGSLSEPASGLLAEVVISDQHPHTLAYQIDRLGNRTGGPASEPGFSEFFQGLDSDSDGQADPPFLAYTVDSDARNRLGTMTDETGSQLTTTFTYDAAGNLESDARFIYGYDAFNRLVTIEDNEIVGTNKLVMALAYDAFGRLITKVTPWDNPWNDEEYRIQTFWHDGARRIQEVIIDPVQATAPWLLEPATAGTPQIRMEFEYVYAAHSGARTDELHAVVDWFDRIAYPLQDASNGTTLGFTTDEGEVVEQYSWSPFGRLLDVDLMPGITEGPTSQNGFSGSAYHDFRIGVGHHGLFAEAMAEPEQILQLRANPLRLGRPTVYHNRNRTYDPQMGRFLQHDPNGTGQTLAGLAFEGKLGWTPPSAFSSEAWFGDGGNLYAAYGHDPVNATDPSGLIFLLDPLVTVAKRRGQAAKAYDAADTAMGIVDDIASGVEMQQILLGLAIDALFDKAGGKAFDAAIGGTQSVAKRFSRGVRKGCNCVPSGTLVATSEGDVPIESIEPGDFVLSVDQFAPDSEPVWAVVEAVIIRETEELIRLTLEDGRTLSMTDSHLIWVDQVGWIDAGDVAAEDLIRTQFGPAARVLSAERVAVETTPTYTLQVGGTHTYFAGGVWVHNSCSISKTLFKKEKVKRGYTKNHSSHFGSEREARALARTKIGDNPIEIEPNKWRSIDGKWQYRAKPGDINDPNGRHIHLEELVEIDGELIVKNNHHLRW